MVSSRPAHTSRGSWMSVVVEELNPYRLAQQQFDTAAEYVANFPSGLREYLRRTMRITTVEFPVDMDDGTTRLFKAWRALNSRVRGPGKGGMRYHAKGTA